MHVRLVERRGGGGGGSGGGGGGIFGRLACCQIGPDEGDHQRQSEAIKCNQRVRQAKSDLMREINRGN